MHAMMMQKTSTMVERSAPYEKTTRHCQVSKGRCSAALAFMHAMMMQKILTMVERSAPYEKND
jgi:hypothetical protein